MFEGADLVEFSICQSLRGSCILFLKKLQTVVISICEIVWQDLVFCGLWFPMHDNSIFRATLRDKSVHLSLRSCLLWHACVFSANSSSCSVGLGKIDFLFFLSLSSSSRSEEHCVVPDAILLSLASIHPLCRRIFSLGLEVRRRWRPDQVTFCSGLLGLPAVVLVLFQHTAGQIEGLIEEHIYRRCRSLGLFGCEWEYDPLFEFCDALASNNMPPKESWSEIDT